MLKNTIQIFKQPQKKKFESWSAAEEVHSCLVELWVLVERSFPEVTNEIVIEFILDHGRLMQTRRTLALSHLGSSRTAGLDLAQLSLPLFLFCFLSFVGCSFLLFLIVGIFGFICHFFFLLTLSLLSLFLLVHPHSCRPRPYVTQCGGS